MENRSIYQEKSDQVLIVRKKRIHKLERHGITWGRYSTQQSSANLKGSIRDQETRSQALSNNESQTSDEKFIHQKSQLSSNKFMVNVPLINQDVLQQELLKILSKHGNVIQFDAKSKTAAHDYNAPNKIKDDLKSANQLKDNDMAKNAHNHISIRIKKPTDYEYRYIGPVKEEPSLKDHDSLKVNSSITDNINFNTLKELLLLFFTHRLNEIDLCTLTSHETRIFQAILERKNYSPSQITNLINLDSLKTSINFSPRRSEEKFKFIIKRIIKYLKKKERIKSEQEFYHVYFSELSEKLGVPLNNFYDPHNKLLKNTHFKSLSTDYVMLLLKSDIFLIELLYYLENGIIKDHIESLETKVGNLCRKWETIYDTLHKSQKSAEFIKQLILNTEKGSKLPWSVGEVTEAIDLMKNIIYSWNCQKFMR